MIEVNGVSLHFGGVQALSGVTFSIGAGEVVGLVGPNGAGKSSLLNCMVGYYRPQTGNVRIAGQSIQGWRAHRVAALGVGRTFQHVGHLQSFTVIEALRLGADAALANAPGMEADEIINQLDLAHVLDKPLVDLDYGTQKMADLGRVLMMRPRLILLDEPTSGVDDAARQKLLELFVVIQRKLAITAVIVDHDPRFVAQATARVVVMDHGTPIADGPTDQVLSDPKVIESFLGVRR